MRLRLTPLNIVIAFLLVAIGYQIIGDENKVGLLPSIYLLLTAFICFVTDLMFRRSISNLQRIWIIELGFIIFAAGLIAVIKAIGS